MVAASIHLESLLATARAASPQDDGLVGRLRRDRVVALRDRERWMDVVDEVTALRTEEMPLPVYVRQAEADALLALRRPAEARTDVRGRARRRPAVAFRPCGALLRAARGRACERRAGAGRRDGGGGRTKTWRGAPCPRPTGTGSTRRHSQRPPATCVGANRDAWRRQQPLVDGAPALSLPARRRGPRFAEAAMAAARRRGDAVAASSKPRGSSEIALAETALPRRYDEARARPAALSPSATGLSGCAALLPHRARRIVVAGL